MVRRILIKGGSGAGKTSLGLKLARSLDLPHVELDGLHHGPNWAAASAVELQARVLATLDDERGWVVDGNYDSKLGNLLLDRAELVIWLDLSLHTKLLRLIRRTGRRLLRQEELWNGNRDTLKGAFWGGESLFGWAVRTHFRHRRLWPQKFEGRNYVRLRTVRDVDAWLSGFCAQHGR